MIAFRLPKSRGTIHPHCLAIGLAQVSPESSREAGHATEPDESIATDPDLSTTPAVREADREQGRLLAESSRLARQIATVAYAMFAVYPVVVLADLLPPQLLDPAWQLRAAASFVTYLTIPLVALVLFLLGVQLAPRDPVLTARRQRLRRWAALAALGFLLLIPVQGFAIVRGMENVSQQWRSNLVATDLMAERLSQAIITSTSTRELQQRLIAMQGPNIAEADLAQPLPVLQRQLLGAVQQIRDRLKDQVRAQSGLAQAWPLLQRAARNVILCLLGAFGFGSLATASSGAPLLTEIAQSWKNAFAGKSASRSGGGGEGKKRQREIVAQRRAVERTRQTKALGQSLVSLFSGKPRRGRKR